MTEPVYPDPFHPVLRNSTPATLSLEQLMAIYGAVDIACSDTQFANKLKEAIRYILLGASALPDPIPVLSSISPNSAILGIPSFTLHVHGSDFTPNSIIVFAGQDEPTTYVSPTEITTGINMSVWAGADVLDVQVKNAQGDLSAVVTFEFKAPTVTSLVPSTVAIGSADFTLRVLGTSFHSGSIIRINGVDAVTIFVSDTELNAPIDMGLVLNPVVAPITVSNGPVVSNSVPFNVTP
jgi:hypothetical protein